MQPLYLSVDLGGTNLRIALLEENGKLRSIQALSADTVRDPAELVRQLKAECEKFHAAQPPDSIRGLALGIPGLIDPVEGIVHQSPHFPNWKEIRLKQALSAHFPFPVIMDNDANHAALGEAWLGAGKQWPNFIMLTLGTGVGGGIIIEGKIFHGPRGFAGEVGHIVIDRHGPSGALGSRGTLETQCSLSGLQLRLQTLQEDPSIAFDGDFLKLSFRASDLPEDLARLARAGDPLARIIWEDFGNALGCGLASLGHTLGIFSFVIGGGLAGAWDLFQAPCHRELSERLYSTISPQAKVVPALLGDQAGLIGGLRSLLSA